MNLEEDTAEEKYFEEQVEIFSDDVCGLYLCKLQKIPDLQSKRLFFINNGLNIMCASNKLKNFFFVRLDGLKKKLDFNFNLNQWKMQGPDETLPNIKIHQVGKHKKIKKNVESLNIESILRNTIEDTHDQKNQDKNLLNVEQKNEELDSYIDEDKFHSAQMRYEEINEFNDHIKSKFKLSENKLSKIGKKKGSNILDMQLENNDLNGFSGFNIKE